MKYTLKNLNCVQETDSEERKKELEAKGYKVVSENVEGEKKAVKKPASKQV